MAESPPHPLSSSLATDATMVLQRLSQGDVKAADELFPLVYAQLRGMAESYFRRIPVDQTLQPTALVHEAYLKLVNQTSANWNDRAHFFAVAATAMRHLLHDRVRRRLSLKRGGGAQRVGLDHVPTPSGESLIDLIALDEALTMLAERDPRQARIVELRFFAGLSNEEVGHVLGLSTRMIEKEWRRTRAWLAAQLGAQGHEGESP